MPITNELTPVQKTRCWRRWLANPGTRSAPFAEKITPGLRQEKNGTQTYYATLGPNLGIYLGNVQDSTRIERPVRSVPYYDQESGQARVRLEDFSKEKPSIDVVLRREFPIIPYATLTEEEAWALELAFFLAGKRQEPPPPYSSPAAGTFRLPRIGKSLPLAQAGQEYLFGNRPFDPKTRVTKVDILGIRGRHRQFLALEQKEESWVTNPLKVLYPVFPHISKFFPLNISTIEYSVTKRGTKYLLYIKGQPETGRKVLLSAFELPSFTQISLAAWLYGQCTMPGFYQFYTPTATGKKGFELPLLDVAGIRKFLPRQAVLFPLRKANRVLVGPSTYGRLKAFDVFGPCRRSRRIKEKIQTVVQIASKEGAVIRA